MQLNSHIKGNLMQSFSKQKLIQTLSLERLHAYKKQNLNEDILDILARHAWNMELSLLS